MNASDIMTSPVITAAPHTPVREIAGLLFRVADFSEMAVWRMNPSTEA